jgi:hypothetical protein
MDEHEGIGLPSFKQAVTVFLAMFGAWAFISFVMIL